MPLSTTQKKKVIKEFQTTEGDTGSPEVQIALLTTRVDRLTEHLKHHIHDTHSRRGLLSMIAKRRRLLNFLTKVDKKRSSEIEKKIGFDKEPLKKVEKAEKVKKATKFGKVTKKK
ncbi:MAG: 30S ribosomal protein S15 [Candidatus Levybacteria bacterium]|nr:30S ribosomal protein S15 [Candidatus Levybacteria bacterium]